MCFCLCGLSVRGCNRVVGMVAGLVKDGRIGTGGGDGELIDLGGGNYQRGGKGTAVSLSEPSHRIPFSFIPRAYLTMHPPPSDYLQFARDRRACPSRIRPQRVFGKCLYVLAPTHTSTKSKTTLQVIEGPMGNEESPDVRSGNVDRSRGGPVGLVGVGGGCAG